MTAPSQSLPNARRSAAIAESITDLAGFEHHSTRARRRNEPGISDFTFGNPHEMPLAGLVNALQAWSTPLNKTGTPTRPASRTRAIARADKVLPTVLAFLARVTGDRAVTA